MINISYIQLINSINKLQSVSEDLLNTQIQADNFHHPVITLLNLIKATDISKYTADEIKTYLLDVIAKVGITDETEKQWILLYLMVYALNITESKNIEYLNKEYSKLSKLSDTDFHKWLEYKVNLAILPIYSKTVYPLINTLNSTSNDIIHLMD